MKHLSSNKHSEFKEKRLIFDSAFDVGGNFENAEAQKEKKEGVEEGVKNKDLVLEIEAQKSIINKKTGEILRSLPEAQRELAKEFFEPLLEKTKKQFDDITKKFLETKEKIGTASWEKSDERWLIVNEAQNLTHKILEEDLDNERVIKAIQKSLLDDLPNPENSEEEKKLISEWIQNSPELKEHYGESGHSDYLDDVLDLATKRYDIRMQDGEVVYVQDLITGDLIQGADFKTHLLKELQPGGKYDPGKLKTEKRAIRKTIKRIKRIRKEIEKGTIFAMGGRINEWEEFNNHKGLEELKTMVDQKEIKRFYEEFEVMQKQAEYVNSFNEVVENADLKGRIEKAEAAGFKVVETERKKVDVSKLDFTAKEVLKNEAGDRIMIEIDDQKRILLTIESSDKSLKIEKSFSNPEDFSKVDLAKTAEKQIENYQKNKAELDRRTELLRSQLKDSDLDFSIPPYSEEQLASKNFKFKPDIIVLEGFAVAEVQFIEGGNIELKARGESPITVAENELGQKTQELKSKLEEVKQGGEKNKVEMNTQWERDVKNLKLPDEFKLQKEEDFNADYTSPSAHVSFGKVMDESGNIIGEIHMSTLAGSEGHIYQFEHEGEWEELNNIEEVGEYITKNQDRLEKSDFDEIEFTGDQEMIAMKNRVHKKLVEKMDQKMDAFLPILSSLGEGVDPKKFKEEIRNGFKPVIEAMPESVLKRMDDSENIEDLTMSKEESKQFLDNMMEDIKANIEEPNEAEMNLLRNMEVDINGENRKFGDVFGEELVELLSMQENIQLQEGSLMIMRRGEYQPTDANGLIDQLPKKLKKKCLNALEGEDLDHEEFGKEVQKAIEKAKKRGETKELLNLIKEGELPENIGEQFAWQQIIMTLIEWIKAGDLSVALDAMKAYNETGLINGFNQARNIYKQGVNNANLGELLAFHKNPKGPVANAKFGDTLFRRDLKQVSQDRMINVLNIESSDLTSWSESNVLIFKKQEKNRVVEYELRLTTGGNANDKAELRRRDPDPEDKPTPHDISDGLTGPGKTLENIFSDPPVISEIDEERGGETKESNE